MPLDKEGFWTPVPDFENSPTIYEKDMSKDPITGSPDLDMETLVLQEVEEEESGSSGWGCLSILALLIWVVLVFIFAYQSRGMG
jgi:hypothetical protein